MPPVPVEARIRRIENIKKFREQFLRFSPRKYCELADFKKIKSSYDAYIVGSDLVWSPRYNREEHLSVYRGGKHRSKKRPAVRTGLRQPSKAKRLRMLLRKTPTKHPKKYETGTLYQCECGKTVKIKRSVRI